MSKKDSNKRREVRAERRLKGLCTECGKQSEIGKTKCLKCLENHNKITSNAHIKNMHDGKCGCGKEKDSPYEYRCSSCKEHHRIESQNLRKKRRNEGLCIRCGKPLIERTDVTKCINCMESSLKFEW